MERDRDKEKWKELQFFNSTRLNSVNWLKVLSLIDTLGKKINLELGKLSL